MPRTKCEKVIKPKGRSKVSTARKITKQEPPEYDRESVQQSLSIHETDNRASSQQDLVDIWLHNFDKEASTALMHLKCKVTMFVEQIELFAFQEFSVLNPDWSKKTLKELRTEKSFSKSVLFETASLSKFLNSTSNATFTVSKKKKPTDDEATESGPTSGDRNRRTRCRSSSVTRQSRKAERTTGRVTRASRSLSRTTKTVTINAPVKQTPENRMRPPMTFGTVTPKMKPNMPVSFLRRPKQGEMAMSMQGSPLLVSGVVTEECANVNIPLTDGRILSMQPNRGLRISEIPHLDEETRRQLTTLRDNLNKVVTITYHD